MNTIFIPTVGILSTLRVYIELHQPLLFSAVSRLGEIYLVSYAELTDEGDLWMVVRLTTQQLKQLESGQQDIRGVFEKPTNGAVLMVQFNDEDENRPKLSYYLPEDKELQEYLAQPGVLVPGVPINDVNEFVERTRQDSVSFNVTVIGRNPATTLMYRVAVKSSRSPIGGGEWSIQRFADRKYFVLDTGDNLFKSEFETTPEAFSLGRVEAEHKRYKGNPHA